MKKAIFDKHCPHCRACHNRLYNRKKDGLTLKERRALREKKEQETGLRKCYMCEKLKPLDEYYTTKNGKYYSYCKPCNNRSARTCAAKGQASINRIYETGEYKKAIVVNRFILSPLSVTTTHQKTFYYSQRG